MPIQTTLNSAKAWSPDVQVFPATEAIPDALIWNATTVVTQDLEGDDPVARIPWVNDDDASFYEEGQVLEESDPELSEVLVHTRKLGKLLKVSREQYYKDRTAEILSTSTQRAITKHANEALLTLQPTPLFPLTGLLNTEGMTTGETITDDLDALADLVAELESADGTPSMILANPRAWAAVRKLKVGADRNDSLVGAGVEAGTLSLLSIPVLKSNAVPDGQLVVIDPTAIAAAVGPVRMATSEDFYFDSDSIALRCTWRFGWAVQHADRLGVVSVSTTAE